MPDNSQEPLSVAEYIDLVNSGLQKFQAKIVGEVTEFNLRSGYLFFTLKDKKDDGVINCFMWRSTYSLYGVELKEGLEVIISGYPSIYAKSGRLSFQTASVELVGEGALKKAYEELKKKLEKEGVFKKERKRPLPAYIQRIGVITSKTGAVIHDFTNNLGRFGFKIKLMDARVEGQQAVRDLLAAISSFKKYDIDVLVIMRGGGSLESLMAFNNEKLVKEVISFPAPVIAAIGHDKDVPLIALAADEAVSTPTAAANLISEPWKRAKFEVDRYKGDIMELYSGYLSGARNRLIRSVYRIKNAFLSIIMLYRQAENQLPAFISKIRNELKRKTDALQALQISFIRLFSREVENSRMRIDHLARMISLNNPARQLKMGYSIARKGGRIIKSVKNVKIGEDIEVQVSDGTFDSNIKKIKNPKQHAK